MFALIRAPQIGWGSAQTILELAGAAALLAAFVVNELRHRHPLFPFSIFRVKGLVAADVTQLVAFAGFLTMFFFVTLYMQDVLRLLADPGRRRLPPGHRRVRDLGRHRHSTDHPDRNPPGDRRRRADRRRRHLLALPRPGPRHLHRPTCSPACSRCRSVPAPCSSASPSPPTPASPHTRPGFAAALLNAARQVGSALGLAIFSAIATSRTQHLLATHTPKAAALTSGYQRALLVSSIFVLAAAIIALRSSDTREAATTPQSPSNSQPITASH